MLLTMRRFLDHGRCASDGCRADPVAKTASAPRRSSLTRIHTRSIPASSPCSPLPRARRRRRSRPLPHPPEGLPVSRTARTTGRSRRSLRLAALATGTVLPATACNAAAKKDGSADDAAASGGGGKSFTLVTPDAVGQNEFLKAAVSGGEGGGEGARRLAEGLRVDGLGLAAAERAGPPWTNSRM